MSTPTDEEFQTYLRVREHLRWDRKGPFDLLRDDDDLYRSSGATTEYGGRLSIWEVYAAGYFDAARELTLLPLDTFFLTFSIYPIIFLYRHSLELDLKHLISVAAKRV